jgi:hypothetical protein
MCELCKNFSQVWILLIDFSFSKSLNSRIRTWNFSKNRLKMDEFGRWPDFATLEISTNCEMKQFFHKTLLKFRNYQQFLIQLLAYGHNYRQMSLKNLFLTQNPPICIFNPWSLILNWHEICSNGSVLPFLAIYTCTFSCPWFAPRSGRKMLHFKFHVEPTTWLECICICDNSYITNALCGWSMKVSLLAFGWIREIFVRVKARQFA